MAQVVRVLTRGPAAVLLALALTGCVSAMFLNAPHAPYTPPSIPGTPAEAKPRTETTAPGWRTRMAATAKEVGKASECRTSAR
jgi:hypothetical protein